MNLGQSIVAGIVVAPGLFLICLFVGGLFLDTVTSILFFFSILAGLVVTCTSLIIYEIGKLRIEIGER